MKDVPHHMKEFLKSFIKEENPKDDKCLKEYRKPVTKNQKKKQTKAKKRKIKTKRTPSPLTSETQNKKIKKRVPKIREREHKNIF